MIFNVCAANWTSYLLDVVVVLFILGFTFVCARKGFIECFFGFVSSFVAIILAFSFAKLLLSATGGFFGLQGALSKKFTEVFSKVAGFDVDVSGMGVKEALKEGDVSAALSGLVLSVFGKSDLPAGTTIGSMLGVSVSKFAVTLFCGALIFAAAKLIIFLLKKTLSKLAEKIGVLGRVDTLLGAIVGLLESVIIVFLVVSVLTIIPSQTITTYLDNSIFVGALYNYNPLVHILGWIL